MARAGLVAVTASLDEHSAAQLLFVAGWHSTAVDQMLQAALLREVGPVLDALL
ncbi:MAG TPA: hypothetical protein VGO74_04150 [Modestobacter sp.]|nr:hypothetical protein [Modestobacter sp.]